MVPDLWNKLIELFGHIKYAHVYGQIWCGHCARGNLSSLPWNGLGQCYKNIDKLQIREFFKKVMTD